MKSKLITINPTGDYRVIAISDIHAHYKHLETLLEKVNLNSEDYLIILGDFIHKGPCSYKTLKIIQRLSLRSRTVILKGNHEYKIQNVMSSIENFKSLYHLLVKEHSENLFHAISRETNRPCSIFTTAEEHYNDLLKHHRDDFVFIGNLPVILNFDEFRFVHGGYDSGFCLDKDERKFLKFDDFNSKSKKNNKTTIVGHWPTGLLRNNQITNMPYFNYEKNIIFIDGGLGVKNTGELNALVIEKIDNKISYSTIQENNFASKEINESEIFNSEPLLMLSYPHLSFEILEQDTELTKCLHKDTNQEFTIINNLIMRHKDEWVPKIEYINLFMNLEVGTQVEVCNEYGAFSLVKYNDEFGWIKSSQI
ncbi:MAG: metallophosphoesterase [Clostridiales bacterium]|nr:metallophosphoesterase [Clostridiales bacterium]